MVVARLGHMTVDGTNHHLLSRNVCLVYLCYLLDPTVFLQLVLMVHVLGDKLKHTVQQNLIIKICGTAMLKSKSSQESFASSQ